MFVLNLEYAQKLKLNLTDTKVEVEVEYCVEIQFEVEYRWRPNCCIESGGCLKIHEDPRTHKEIKKCQISILEAKCWLE